LANLPWEFLYDGRNFLALSDSTPIVRYLDLPDPPRRMMVELPLRVLVTISSPADLPPLNVKEEEYKMREALAGLVNKGLVQIDFTPDATLSTLQRTLRQGRTSGQPYHVWHYIGHGAFDLQANESVLMMVNDLGVSYRARGFQLGTLFNGYPELRLALLNACEGARPGPDDPFGGVAAALVERGISAVIGMQFEITDRAAITFAGEFYAALVDGLPVDAALTEARRAIFFLPNWIEWATPVLFMRVQDGRLFEMTSTGSFPVPKGRQAALTAPTQSRRPPPQPSIRLPGTAFLGKAIDRVVAELGQFNGKPKEAASPPLRGLIASPLVTMAVRVAAVAPVAASKSGGEARHHKLVYQPLPYEPGPTDRHLLKTPWRLQLDIVTPSADSVLGVDLYGEAIIGRSAGYPGQPILDLEPFGAKELGVSRQHLVIRPTQAGLQVIDQGSTNGTLVNGRRCPLGSAVSVKDGDMLLLSQLEIILHVVQKPG
jgi:hypothetical protein